MIVALMLSNVFFILFGLFGYKANQEYYNKTKSYTKQAKVYEWLSSISLCLFNILYCVTYWIFAMKYLYLAIKLDKQIKQTSRSQKELLFLQIMYWVFFILNIVLPCFDILAFSPKEAFFNYLIADCSTCFVQLFSCVVILTASIWIYVNSKKHHLAFLNTT